MEATTVGSAIVSGIVRESLRRAVAVLSQLSRTADGRWPWHEAGLANHLQWVASWSASMQIGGMSAPVDIEANTIPVRFYEDSIECRAHDQEADAALSERDLLTDSLAYMITGEPGGGKTTAVKRIAQILLKEPAHGESWQYPIVVLLRDLPRKQSLIAHVAQLLGFGFELPAVNNVEAISHAIQQDGETLFQLVARTLNETGAVLLLDGLDEVDLTERRHIELEAQDLIQVVTAAKIIIFARIGAVDRVFENVRRVRVAPLNRSQALAIAERWLPDPAEFFRELDRMPYQDLAVRPLFLVRLLVLFKRLRCLPNQPCDIYDRFIRLLLEDWDRERDVTRLSRYANFGPDQKMRFLAGLSNHLLIETRSVSFSRFQLERAYVRLSSLYQLPELQAEQVVGEITSHTGLIVPARFGQYEFSHLSLQEYLCAHYLVRDPLLADQRSYLKSYPAPLAIATTMAANPSAFFASLALEVGSEVGVTSWDIYLQRLEYERPRFSEGNLLGLAVLKVISDHRGIGASLLVSGEPASFAGDQYDGAIQASRRA